jgi:hypothetical protein
VPVTTGCLVRSSQACLCWLHTKKNERISITQTTISLTLRMRLLGEVLSKSTRQRTSAIACLRISSIFSRSCVSHSTPRLAPVLDCWGVGVLAGWHFGCRGGGVEGGGWSGWGGACLICWLAGCLGGCGVRWVAFGCSLL